jgi:hypothetical protein
MGDDDNERKERGNAKGTKECDDRKAHRLKM